MQRFQIIFAGYGPENTSFSKSLKIMGDKISTLFPDLVDVKYVYNIMDLGYKAEDILWMTDQGILTVAYQSTSYLTDDVPELGFVDLPFLFRDNSHARGAMDGALGLYLKNRIEDRKNYKILGYLENGFRQISNSIRVIRQPDDMKDLKIRVLPSDIHSRFFELIGANPIRMDLTKAITDIQTGSLDAQENPYTNTTTYGVHNYHKYHTLSNHFYISRAIMCNRSQFYLWPELLKQAIIEAAGDAMQWQRTQIEADVKIAEKLIVEAGGQIHSLTEAQTTLFKEKIAPLYKDARDQFGNTPFDLLSNT